MLLLLLLQQRLGLNPRGFSGAQNVAIMPSKAVKKISPLRSHATVSLLR